MVRHQAQDIMTLLVMTSALSIVVILMNAFAIAKPQNFNRIGWYGLISALTLFMLMTVTHNFSTLPENIMAKYKFGHILTEQVILRGEACDIAELMDIPLKRNNQNCLIADVLIHSRLGREAYLQYPSAADGLRFVIASEDLRSWVIRTSSSNNSANSKLDIDSTQTQSPVTLP